MESYVENLVNTIAKKFSVSDRNDIKKKVTEVFRETLQGKRQEATTKFYEIISKLTPLPTTESNREQERLETIISFLQQRNLTPRNLLDIGAGNGKITMAVKNHFGLPRQEVYAIDTKLPVGIDLFPLTYKENKIPLPDHSIDLIMMFMVLHHISENDRENLLREVNRVITSNGLVIIREHDDDKDPNFLAYIDLIHIFWYMLGEETIDPLYLMSRTETAELFAKVGLKSLAFSEYQGFNPQRIYHEAFVPVVYPFRFADKSAQEAVQVYINKMKTSQDMNLVPVSVRGNKPWPTLLKESGVAILSEAAKMVPPINGYHNITAAAVYAAIASIQQICPTE